MTRRAALAVAFAVVASASFGAGIGGRRYSHIIDARSGRPTTGWRSISVIAPLCVLAGTCATMGMLFEADADANAVTATDPGSRSDASASDDDALSAVALVAIPVDQRWALTLLALALLCAARLTLARARRSS